MKKVKEGKLVMNLVNKGTKFLQAGIKGEKGKQEKGFNSLIKVEKMSKEETQVYLKQAIEDKSSYHSYLKRVKKFKKKKQ